MHTIQVELSDELAKMLAPYRDALPTLLELGLQEWLKRQQQELPASRESITQVLAASAKVRVPEPYANEKPYVRHTPVPITGKPVSEIVIEQRGSL